VDHLIHRPPLDQLRWHDGAKRENVGFDLLPRSAPDAVKACKCVCVRSMQEEVPQLVEEHRQPLWPGQFGTHGDKIAAHHSVIESARHKRLFDNRHAESMASVAKVTLVERPFVPSYIEFCDPFG